MDDNHHALHGDFDPLLIAILGCLAGVFIVASYHYVTTRCTSPVQNTEDERQGNRPEPWPGSSGGGSTLPSYRHVGHCKVDGTCAVCLSEFSDGEMIRVLPECLHSFHAPCIDMWLYSHSSCPLCRANTRLLPLSNLPRRFVPSSSHSSTEVWLPISSTPATPQAQISEDTSPRTVTGSLVTFTSHSDESGQQTLMSVSTSSVTVPFTDSGDEFLTEAESPVPSALHSNEALTT